MVLPGLPTLGTVLSPVDPVLEKRQQHRTYSNAFVGQLHAFVETAIADAQVPLFQHQVIRCCTPPPTLPSNPRCSAV